MKRLCLSLLLLALYLHAAPPAGAVDSGSAPADSLRGKTMLVLGDSYTAAYGLRRPEEGWTSLMASSCGMTELNYSISGSSMASGPGSFAPMVERCAELPADAAPDIILVQGGSNDWAKNLPVGTAEDRTPETTCGALNLILDHLEAAYPGAAIVCFTPWISDHTENALGLLCYDYNEGMLAVCAARGVHCYDAANTEQNGMLLTDETFRAKYCLTDRDWYHLNFAGHRHFAPIMAQWLSRTLYHTDAAVYFADLCSAPEQLQSAVSAVIPAGLMDCSDDALFYPTRSATRETLALALYRLAGQPSTGYLSFSDVSSESSAYPAICYAVESGLLSATDCFSPDQSLTREALAAALYQYFEHTGGTAERLTGLGSFPDNEQITSRVAFGWAMANGLLTEKDGLLRPNGAVSRGELAEALAIMLEK